MELAHTYSATIAAMGALAALMFIQLLVADVIGLRSGHMPGAQVQSDHDSLLFRVTRTVGNTNESIAIFVLAVLFCMLGGASVSTTAYAAWGFVVMRFLYAVCYYANWQLPRSMMFGMSLLALAILIGAGVAARF